MSGAEIMSGAESRKVGAPETNQPTNQPVHVFKNISADIKLLSIPAQSYTSGLNTNITAPTKHAKDLVIGQITLQGLWHQPTAQSIDQLNCCL